MIVLDSEENSASVGGGQYAIALRDLTQRYERLVRGLSLLRQIDQIDKPDLSFEQVCISLMRLLAQGFAAENCSLLLFDAEKSELVLCAAASALDDNVSFVNPQLWKGKRFRLGEGIAGQAAASRKIIRCNDVKNEAEFIRIPDSPVEIHALMCVPLQMDLNLVGVINFSHSRPAVFMPETERMATIVGERCARLLAAHLYQHERRKAEDYYRLVAERVGDGVMVYDSDDQLVNANATIETLSGQPLHDFLTSLSYWEDGVLNEDKEAFIKHRQRVRQKLGHSTFEYRYRDNKGSIHQIEERCSALNDSQGNIQGYVCILRDQTEQKRIEQEKHHLEKQLLHAQKMEAIGRLAGGVAHDFNNLLTGILANITLAETLNDLPTIRRLLSEAEKAARRAAEVTRQLLTMSRKSQVAKRAVNLGEIMNEVETILRNTFDPNIEISFYTEPGLWDVMAAPDQLHQLLLNLCVNARDALMAKKSLCNKPMLRLDVTAENFIANEDYCERHLDARPGHFVTLTVSDTGIGIEKSIQNHIFEPFFTTKSEDSGTGLGLSIVYAIIKEHGGWITFWSESGQGTSFCVYLPVAHADTLTIVGDKKRTPERLHGTETILFVDDEDFIRRLGESILEPYGYRLLVAHNGLEAIEILEKHATTVDIVILDLLMPKLSGEEVLRHIRDSFPNMKVIVSTGHTDDIPSKLTGKFSPNAYLKKPYSHMDLLRTIRVLLDFPSE